MYNFFKNPKAICCHASRVNPLTELLENRSVYGVTIIVQTFCGLKEIALTVMELYQKHQLCVKSTQ